MRPTGVQPSGYGLASGVDRRDPQLLLAVPSDAQNRPVTVGNLTVDALRVRTTTHGVPIRLTLSEFRLLLILVSSPGQVVPHNKLAQQLWGYPKRKRCASISIHIPGALTPRRITRSAADNQRAALSRYTQADLALARACGEHAIYAS
jgi:DNA-binding response OmpR family regulator